MKKSFKHNAFILVTMVMILSVLAIPALAVSRTFFVKNVDSYKCQGSGSLSGTTASAAFTATALPNKPILPDEQYSSEIVIFAYNSANEMIGSSSRYGTTSAQASYTAPGTISWSGYTFHFSGHHLGRYVIKR